MQKYRSFYLKTCDVSIFDILANDEEMLIKKDTFSCGRDFKTSIVAQGRKLSTKHLVEEETYF